MRKDKPVEQFSMRDPRHQTDKDWEFTEGMNVYFKTSLGTTMNKLRNFAKFVPRQDLSIFLAKNELFKKVINIHGHIIECGVFVGGGLMTWAQLSAIYEPYNHIRRIVGFDTFTGFPSLSNKDVEDSTLNAVKGGLATHAIEDIRKAIRLYDLNRPIGHIPRIELVIGDALQTIPRYIKDNPHVVVALLYLNLYEPTKVAVETFLPRMPTGAILAFDELNQSAWPGETLAVLETVGIRNLHIQVFRLLHSFLSLCLNELG
jgi:hypothetical protein